MPSGARLSHGRSRDFCQTSTGAGAVAQTGVDPTLDGRAPQDALRRAKATRRGYCSWTVDHAGWVVTLHSPEEPDFSGKTLEEALAWCLAWLMAKGTGHPKGLDWGYELGIGPFVVQAPDRVANVVSVVALAPHPAPGSPPRSHGADSSRWKPRCVRPSRWRLTGTSVEGAA